MPLANELAEMQQAGTLDPEVVQEKSNQLLIDRVDGSGRWVLSHVCGPDAESPENQHEVGVVLYREARGFWSREG